MKDGPYLLVWPGEQYGTPITLKNNVNPDGTPFQIIAGVDGVRLVSNLPPGHKFIPLMILTEERRSALASVLEAASYGYSEGWDGPGVRDALEVIQALLAEVEAPQKSA